jgi:hypothetical protein
MKPIHWIAVLMYSSLVSVGVESVQEKDVSSIILVVIALVAVTIFGFMAFNISDNSEQRWSHRS